MPRIDNTEFYTAALKKYGDTAQGVHWNSIDSQQRRFKVLANLICDDFRHLSIVDAGCGFGDFYRYLCDNAQQPQNYTGLEIMEPMVETAKERTSCTILQCDVLNDELPSADYYVCSGAMNILTRFETHLFIRRCYEASTKGFVFNLLEGEDESLVYNYFLPREVKAIAKELGAKIKIKQGYLPRDFTVALYKSKGWF